MTQDVTSPKNSPQKGPQKGPPKPGMRGWQRGLLIVSVTLNLLVLGVIVGGILGHDRHPPRPVIEDVSLGPFTDALSREDREALRREAEREGQSFRQMRSAAKADFEALIGALEAEPFDEAGVQQMLEGQRARMISRLDIGERLMLEQLRAMTPQERRAFAGRLREGAARAERTFAPPGRREQPPGL